MNSRLQKHKKKRKLSKVLKEIFSWIFFYVSLEIFTIIVIGLAMLIQSIK